MNPRTLLPGSHSPVRRTSRRLLGAALGALVGLGMAVPTASAATAGDLGDANGDGLADIWTNQPSNRYVRDTSLNGHTTYYKGWSSRTDIGISKVTNSNMGLGDADQVAALPDMTGDHKADMLARLGDHVYLYTSDGNGTMTRSTEIGHGWGAMDTLVYAGNLNGDSTRYLLGRSKVDHGLYAYKLLGGGAVSSVGKVGQNWGGMKFLLAPGQMAGDAKADLIGIRTDGTMWCYRGTGLGKVGGASQCGRGWNGFRAAFIAGDMDGNGSWDLVGVRDVVHPNGNCSSRGVCDPAEKLCTSNPAGEGAYADEYEVPTTKDFCVTQGYSHRLKDAYRAPMYVYRNLGGARWGAADRLGYDMFSFDTFA